MNPACSATPISVPKVSNRTMNRKMRMNGSMGNEAAPMRSILKNVGSMLGGAETRFARSGTFCMAGKANCFISIDSATGLYCITPSPK